MLAMIPVTCNIDMPARYCGKIVAKLLMGVTNHLNKILRLNMSWEKGKTYYYYADKGT